MSLSAGKKTRRDLGRGASAVPSPPVHSGSIMRDSGALIPEWEDGQSRPPGGKDFSENVNQFILLTFSFFLFFGMCEGNA